MLQFEEKGQNVQNIYKLLQAKKKKTPKKPNCTAQIGNTEHTNCTKIGFESNHRNSNYTQKFPRGRHKIAKGSAEDGETAKQIPSIIQCGMRGQTLTSAADSELE